MPGVGQDLEVLINQVSTGDRIMGAYKADFEQEVRKAITNQEIRATEYDLECEMRQGTASGVDLGEAVKESAGGYEGIDLGTMVRKAIVAHTIRKGCRWVDGAAEAIIASPEFTALAEVMEKYEICNADTEGTMGQQDLAAVIRDEASVARCDLAAVIKDGLNTAPNYDLALIIKEAAE